MPDADLPEANARAGPVVTLEPPVKPISNELFVITQI
jgi:hypothetical protein